MGRDLAASAVHYSFALYEKGNCEVPHPYPNAVDMKNRSVADGGNDDPAGVLGPQCRLPDCHFVVG